MAVAPIRRGWWASTSASRTSPNGAGLGDAVGVEHQRVAVTEGEGDVVEIDIVGHAERPAADRWDVDPAPGASDQGRFVSCAAEGPDDTARARTQAGHCSGRHLRSTVLCQQRCVQPMQDLTGRGVWVRSFGSDRVAGQCGQHGGLDVVPAYVAHHGPPLAPGLEEVVEIPDDLDPVPGG
jgi:hypothetical protein